MAQGLESWKARLGLLPSSLRAKVATFERQDESLPVLKVPAIIDWMTE